MTIATRLRVALAGVTLAATAATALSMSPSASAEVGGHPRAGDDCVVKRSTPRKLMTCWNTSAPIVELRLRATEDSEVYVEGRRVSFAAGEERDIRVNPGEAIRINSSPFTDQSFFVVWVREQDPVAP